MIISAFQFQEAMCLRRCCGWEVLPMIYTLVAILGPTLTYVLTLDSLHSSLFSSYRIVITVHVYIVLMSFMFICII